MDQESESLLNDSVPSMTSNKRILGNATIIEPKPTDIFPFPSFFTPQI